MTGVTRHAEVTWVMKVLSMKMLRNEAKTLFLIFKHWIFDTYTQFNH